MSMMKAVLVLAASLFALAFGEGDEVLKNAALENEHLFEGDILSLNKNAMVANWK